MIPGCNSSLFMFGSDAEDASAKRRLATISNNESPLRRRNLSSRPGSYQQLHESLNGGEAVVGIGGLTFLPSWVHDFRP